MNINDNSLNEVKLTNADNQSQSVAIAATKDISHCIKQEDKAVVIQDLCNEANLIDVNKKKTIQENGTDNVLTDAINTDFNASSAGITDISQSSEVATSSEDLILIFDELWPQTKTDD